MPHLTLEYTSNLDEWANDPGLLIGLHRLLESAAGIKIENCKSRWRMVEEWVVGDGEGESAFVHLDLRFLEGRPPRVKEAVGTGAVELLRAHFAPAPDGLKLQITVEVQDIRRDTYFKHPPGTLGPPTLSLV
ncbi:MAG: 5-carboxymethyl-2-hydroxymuconate Delta-isomerase [Gemmatimonadota bacterium]